MIEILHNLVSIPKPSELSYDSMCLVMQGFLPSTVVFQNDVRLLGSKVMQAGTLKALCWNKIDKLNALRLTAVESTYTFFDEVLSARVAACVRQTSERRTLHSM